MGRSFNRERAALILCDSMLMGDRAAAEKWGVNRRTICRYHERLKNDDKLGQLVTVYREKQVRKWLQNLPEAISSVIDFMQRSTNSIDPANADNLLAASKALEVLFDVQITQSVIDARLGRNQSAD